MFRQVFHKIPKYQGIRILTIVGKRAAVGGAAVVAAKAAYGGVAAKLRSYLIPGKDSFKNKHI